ncbi:hypothetical protein V8G54_027375 [Vigna mungo]|uniref:Uncharacterized protein n=1 Tax=Vigna mungo TaxID=3915 RepID=A0AAQ3RRC1_VIGMU
MPLSINPTSNGVNGHLPSTRLAPGFIILCFLLNLPRQLLSRAISISCFSSSPPSYSQHENATISSSKRRCTETYFPPLWELYLIILSTMLSASACIGSENLRAPKLAKHLRRWIFEGTA